MTPDGETLRDRLSRALPAALKARDRRAVDALRSALAAIDNAQAVDPSRAPPLEAGPPPAGPADGPPGFAGTVAGLGATEVERRSLSGAQMEEIVRAEIAERETAAAAYERAGQLEHAERLRAEAEILISHLDRT